MVKFNKKGELITYTNRSHRKFINIEHGEPFRNDVPRPGTKAWQKAGSGGGKSRGRHGGSGGRERKDKISKINNSEELKSYDKSA